MDDIKTKLHDLDTTVAVLGVQFENLQNTVEKNHTDTKLDLEGISKRFDRFEQRLDERDKRNGNGAHYQSHDMKRNGDKPDAITLTVPKDFFHRMTKTLILIIVSAALLIAASMVGIPVKGLIP